MKKTSKESFDKKLIIGVLVLLIPIICVIVAIVIKSPEENKNISRDTYVHVFYVKNTDVKDEVKNTLAEIDGKYKVVYHDITSDND